MQTHQHKPDLILLLGLPGAGKSTFVQTFIPPESFPHTRLIITMDAIRLAYGHVYQEDLEDAVHHLAYNMTSDALELGHTVIIDESITRTEVALAFAEIAHRNGVKMNMLELDTPVELCFSRREKTGFPPAEFNKKQREWAANRAAIIALADVHRVHRGVHPANAH